MSVISHKRDPSIKSKRLSSISSDTLEKMSREGSDTTHANDSPGNGVSRHQDRRPPPSPADQSKARRRALKDFYKLQAQQAQQLNKIAKSEDVVKADEGTATATATAAKVALTPATFDEYVEHNDFITLLKDEDEILEELSNNQSEIKSIIYNNYYELIKINDILMNLKEQNEQRKAGGGVEENLERVRGALGQLKEIDVDVFGTATETADESALLKRKEELKEDIYKAVNRLILGRNVSGEQLQSIDDVLPKLKSESVILQLNEIKEKAARR